MNTTKRLVALVLCVLMVCSMLSGFALASQAEQTVSQAVADVNPLDDNVIIFDAKAPLGVGADYTLVWNNEQFDGLKTMEKVFRTIDDFSDFVIETDIEDLVVLVINMPEGALRLEKAMTLYSPAYNIEPYIRGTAIDGSDWKANPEFDAVAAKITGNITVAKTVTGELNFYGFVLNGNIIDTARANTTPLNINLTNVVIDSKGTAGNPVFTLNNAYNKLVTGESSLVLRNVYYAGAAVASPRLFTTNELPAYINIDGLFIDRTFAPKVIGSSTIKQVQNNCEFAIRNSNIYGYDTSLLTFSANTKVIAAGSSKSIVFENNIMGANYDEDYVIGLHTTRYSSLKINDNYIAAIDSTGEVELVTNTYSNSTLKNFSTDVKFDLEITGNVFNGIANELKIGVSNASKYKNELRDTIFTLGNNYITTVYAADLTGVEGQKFSATVHGITAREYYKDYLKTILLNEDIFIKSAQASNGFFILDESTRKVYYIINSGDATSVNFELGSDEAQVKWYSDKDCLNAIEAKDVAYNGKGVQFFFRVEKQDGEKLLKSDVYTVQITRETAFYPFFLTEFKNDPYINSNAVLCDVGSAYIADGRLYTAEWNGKVYTFIKGVNVFDTLDNAILYQRKNGVENPQFMLKDLNGSKVSSVAWNVTYPASYFTENYINSPVIKGTAMDGSDWAYNKGTGAGQFDPDKTIEVLDLAFPKNGVAGEYNFYGFTISRSVADWSAFDHEIKVHITNCVFDIDNWGAAALLRADEFKYPTEEQRAFESELVIKDSYFFTNGTTGRLTSGTLAATVRFDGIFFDGPLGTISATDYLQQVTYKSVFAIENSLIKNYFKTGIFYNEGMWNKKATASTDKSYIINNNTFVNSQLSAGGIVDQMFDYFNRAEFIGNKVYSETPVGIFYYRSGSGSGSVPFTLIIKDNLINAGKPNLTLAARAYTGDTAITNNYITDSFYLGNGVTYGGVPFVANVNSSPIDPDSVYYIDSARKIPGSKINDFTFEGENVIFNKTAKTVKVTVPSMDTAVFKEIELSKFYAYTLDISSIVKNDLSNAITFSFMGKQATLGSAITVYTTDKTQKQEFPIEVTVSVSSPDGTKTPVNYTLIIDDNGPGIKDVSVDGEVLEYVDGGYSIELGSRNNGEIVAFDSLIEGTELVLMDGNTVVDDFAVDVAPGQTKKYTLKATLDGETYTAPLVVTRRSAEFDELDSAITSALAVDMSRWLPKYAVNLKNAIKMYNQFDRESATQAEVDELTALITNTLSNYIERVEIDALVAYAKTFRNVSNKYCHDVFDELKTAIAVTGDVIPTIETQQQYDDAIAYLQNAIDALTLHEFGEYVSNNDATYDADGTKTAVCVLCEYAKTVVDEYTKLERVGWIYENGFWSFYEDSEKVTSKWMKDSIGWVYLNEEGNMDTNKWIKDSVGWCYVGSNGYCVTNKWVKDSKGWCYLGADGRMVYNQWIEDSLGWCYVGKDGYCVTNTWMKDSIGWVYLDAEGRMATNKWIKDSIGWCYVGEDGYCVKDTYVEDSNGWCYLDASGYWNGKYVTNLIAG